MARKGVSNVVDVATYIRGPKGHVTEGADIHPYTYIYFNQLYMYAYASQTTQAAVHILLAKQSLLWYNLSSASTFNV